jgi:hypothetical protein
VTGGGYRYPYGAGAVAAGAAVGVAAGAAAASSYFPAPYYTPPCGYYPYPACY